MQTSDTSCSYASLRMYIVKLTLDCATYKDYLLCNVTWYNSMRLVDAVYIVQEFCSRSRCHLFDSSTWFTINCSSALWEIYSFTQKQSCNTQLLCKKLFTNKFSMTFFFWILDIRPLYGIWISAYDCVVTDNLCWLSDIVFHYFRVL